MKFMIKLISTMAGVWVTTLLISGIRLTDDSTWQITLLTLAVFSLALIVVNKLVRPVLKLLSLPLLVLTLGLFSFILNALMFMLAGWISVQTHTGIMVDSFWAALLGALITSVIASLISNLLDSKED
ncbi:hypothetical protein HMPREF0044_1533 [Gleimia coleocanis DSM 15436]|uniref:Mycobacterial 4 TMS phage holin, superfamily IV n=2 Tax=Gleimia TaxID=2692113 RepID=C0W280_9ACTO|nr:hypothetical protein HMPREF0044_1533 [Gleimia coleocanis DSM 15436]